LIIASAVAAATMALLGYAGGGELGNFGHVGVDQTTFGPAVFLWFVAIGGLTVAMTGGIARRQRVARVVEEVADDEPEDIEPEDVEPEPLEPPITPKRTFWRKSASDSRQNVDLDADLEPELEHEPIDEDVPVEPLFRAGPDVDDFDDLPDPEDFEYIDDDATPGSIGDQRRPADD
jgi:hypothetical protein